jgi:hypothetical protein
MYSILDINPSDRQIPVTEGNLSMNSESMGAYE